MKQFTLFFAGLFLLSYSTSGQVNKTKAKTTKPVDTKTTTPAKPAAAKARTPAVTTPAVPKAPFVKASEERCVEVIRTVFKDYLQLEEGITDAHEKKVLMQKAIRTLPDALNKAELPLLLNVYMYYDPGDIATRTLLWPIFMKNKAIVLEAIDYRIKHREKWEAKDTAPFTDLILLTKRMTADD